METLPDWWEWELEFTSHLLKRMIDRGFNEADLRTMLDDATNVVPQPNDRFQVTTTHEKQTWIVIVEPDETDEKLLVVTAYPCD